MLIAVALASIAPPAQAQRGATGRPPVRPTGTQPKVSVKPDTIRKAPPAVALDFQDQELRVVLDALAASAEVNVSLTNIPSQRITMHMGRPVTREAMIELLKSVAETHGLKVTESPSLIQIVGPTNCIRYADSET
jgi:hypothetical protein